jgi:hypothetical protein
MPWTIDAISPDQFLITLVGQLLVSLCRTADDLRDD